MLRSAAILAVLAAALGGCVQQHPPRSDAQAAAGRQCFLGRNVSSFGVVGNQAAGNQAVDVTVGIGRYYRLGISAGCPFADFSLRAALRTTTGDPWICDGMDAELIFPGPAGPQRCFVTSVHPITKAEWLATKHR